MRGWNPSIVVSALILSFWGGFYGGKRAADHWWAKHCPIVIGYEEPKVGTCLAYATSSVIPGKVYPVWVPCP